MTYPPQPGQPQYGHDGQQYPEQQYQQGGYDQSGAYPQQQYPAQQPYPQQQYPGQYQQYGQGFGGPPAPPKKSNTGLLVGIAAAVVVLVTLAITGFAAPGFFLSDDKPGPEATARAIVDGINAHDRTALTALKCGNAEKDVTQAIEHVSEVSDAMLGETTKASETEYTMAVTLNVEGRTRTGTGTLAREGEKWCWKEIGRFRTKTSTTSTTR